MRRVYGLTKQVHTRLPREVRDMIHAYLLTLDDISNISRCSRVRLDRFTHSHDADEVGIETSCRVP
ncbi:hypothetical protein EJ02DRAFT_50227 [Clathrospora elynae]|uniref:Uncharacterized protein n=1 Tax=Clathrospora elynae TaxID=706981 RepID=A0A6A5SCC6_9PLEO|nr:hypothetical protein EJ02DRAFT_50227 [Clathrospora elynae]